MIKHNKLTQYISGLMAIVMLMTLLSVSGKVTKTQAAENLIKNGDFATMDYWIDENGEKIRQQGVRGVIKDVSTTLYNNDFSGVKPTTGWNLGTETETTSEVVELEGNDVLSLKVGTRQYDTYYGTSFEKGKKYTVSCRVLSKNKDASFRLYYSDNIGEREHKSVKANIWTDFSITIDCNGDITTPSIFFGIMNNSTEQIYIDDVKIVCDEKKTVQTYTEGIGNCNKEEDTNILVMDSYSKVTQQVVINKKKTYEYSFDIKKVDSKSDLKTGLTASENSFDEISASDTWKTVSGYFEATSDATEFGFTKSGTGLVLVRNVYLAEKSDDENNGDIITTRLNNLTDVKLLSGKIYDIVANYDYTKLPTEQYWTSNKNEMEEVNTMPKSVEINWNCKENANSYTVKLADNNKLNNAKEYTTNEKSITVNDLYAGTTYYYQVIATTSDKIIRSKLFRFTTADLTRTIFIDGVSNTRDIGGYQTSDGKRIRQGLVYRGGNLDNITQEGKNQFKALGIKTDLELRQAAKRGTESPVGSDINYITVDEKGAPQYRYDYGIDIWRTQNVDTENAKNALLNEIKTFTKKENYPIYVHCAIGRDRTGTICFLINALCGVEKNDLYKDYELSILSKVCHDGTTPDKLVNDHFYNMYEFINSFEGNNLAEKTEAYMKKLGISDEEIKTIRNIMIEDEKNNDSSDEGVIEDTEWIEKITPQQTTTKKQETTKKDGTTMKPVTTTANITTKKVVTTTQKTVLKNTKISSKPSKKLNAKKVKITFKKVSKAKKYTVQFSTKKNFKKILLSKKVKKTTVTISSNKLKNKKTLYVRVKAVGAVKWSAVKKIKIK